VTEHEPGSFLKATLESQPDELARLIAGHDAVSAAAERLRGTTRLFLAGTGTSYHGAVAGQFIMRGAGLDAWAVRAFEFANYPPVFRTGDGLVLLSHRGSKRFSRTTLELFARVSDHWVVITGEGSALEGDGVLHTVEQERSPVHTASHTGAMVRLAQIAVALGQPSWSDELPRIPDAVRAALGLRAEVAAAAAAIESGRVVHFAGGGPARTTAYEGALKLREAAHAVSAEAHDIEGILHGPLVSIQPGEAAVLVAQPGAALDRTREVADALHEIGVRVIAVGPAAFQVEAVDRVLTPEVSEVLAPIVNVVPLQWLAYEVASRIGVDADSFRRDEERYAAAQSRFTL
jgi:glucosamine--fructose-6-phosphate aminotransferase (isomerizing)